MSDQWGDPTIHTSQEMDRHHSLRSLVRKVGDRVVEEVSWNDWGAFYKRFDDEGTVVESRRATTADYNAAQGWSKHNRPTTA